MKMDKDNENTSITQQDLSFLQEELTKSSIVPTLHEMALKLAYKKNASQLNQEVKKFDPECIYEVGDLICKAYDEPLLVSSKGVEPFKGEVVLKVINKIKYDSFQCEMLEVDFSGGGVFRKHIDYMKKTKTQVLLPSSMDNKAKTPKIVKKDEDPRLNELPMTEKDLRSLEKNLGNSLSHSDKFFTWKNYWQLTEKQVAIPEKTIKNIEKKLKKKQQSATTAALVSEFLEISTEHADFDLYCLSLNNILEKKYKKNFVFVSPSDWGKWHLKESIDALLKEIPLSKSLAKIPTFKSEAEFTSTESQEFPLKLYLTWREVLSGGISVPKNVAKELSLAREYYFTDAETKDQYCAYFYPSKAIFLGFKEFYEKNNVTQGASLTLEKGEGQNIKFSLKKAKKKLTVPQVTYDQKKDKFKLNEEEVTTSSLPNKILFLEKEILQDLFSLYDQRGSLDLRELLILIFKNFGLEGEALSLHLQRAYHLVDTLKNTNLEDVEKVLFNSQEFAVSEKKKGLFLYQEKDKGEEEIPLEDILLEDVPAQLDDALESVDDDGLPEIGTVGEIEAPTVILEEKIKPQVIEPKKKVVEEKEAPPPMEAVPTVEPAAEKPVPKKEKEPKKKRRRAKIEVEKAPRRKKGERKIIEERIELEESELEALIAIKSKEKKDLEEAVKVAPEEKEVAYKPTEEDKPLSGVFGEMLKSALSQKEDAPPEKKEKKTVTKAKTTKPKAKAEPKPTKKTKEPAKAKTKAKPKAKA